MVVNDGSSEDYDYIFKSISQIENVTYLKYGENRGKGYALKTAFKYCADTFSKNDTVITADCDGQHKIEDVVSVYKACITHPKDLILGSRNFDLPNVPKRSRAGNLTTRRIFSALYGLKLYDTQTGLRGFSVEIAEKLLGVRGERFEYEMNMLIYAKKHSVRILETPIETVYSENDEEHVSHFRSVRDSARVMGATLSNLNFYMLSSVISAIIDVAAFFVLSTFIFKEQSAVNTLIATVGARVLSSAVNFILNFKYVFVGTSRWSFIKYYILWSCQLGASYGIAFLFGNVIGLNLTISKAVGDLCLALLSYQIQQYWVFKGKDPYKFYGPFVGIVRAVWKKFSKKYRCNVLPYDEGAVYVCRHLDMHGPYTTLKWLDFHVHPMVLSVFFDKKKAYRQYSEYTFTEKKGKKKRKFNFKAYVSSRVVPPLIKSLESVPVYRGKDILSVKTFKKSLEYLKKNQSIIVYPDIDYSGSGDKVSEIYEGFLYLGELYRKKTQKSLKFVPIYINEEEMTVNQCDYITVDSFKNDKAWALEYIKKAINTK